MRPLSCKNTLHALLGAAYLFLSFYTISCAFHHDLGPRTGGHIHNAHGGHTQTPENNPDSGVHLACRLVQKIGGAALAPDQVTLDPLNLVSQIVPDVLLSFPRLTPSASFARGPPPPIA